MTAKLTIGMDPELVIVDNSSGKDQLVRAGDFIRREAKFGLDGHTQQYLTELRPEPAVRPRTLVKNLKNVLQSGMRPLGKFKWWSGAWQFDMPLGGHIHFGCTRTDKLVTALDNQLAPILALVEPEDQARMRRTKVVWNGKPYGQLSDTRDKAWGFEYRTPASFLPTPGTTMGVLAIAKACVLEELEGGECAFSKLSREQRKELTFTPDDFNSARRDVFEQMIDPLWKIFRKMRYFQEGQEGADSWSTVAYLKNKVAEHSFNANRDVRKSWKLEEEKAPPLAPGAAPDGPLPVQGIVFADPGNAQARILGAWGEAPAMARVDFNWVWDVLRRDADDRV